MLRVLIGGLVVAAVVVAGRSTLPDVARYVKMRRM